MISGDLHKMAAEKQSEKKEACERKCTVPNGRYRIP